MFAEILQAPRLHFYNEFQKSLKEDPSSYRILQIVKRCFYWLASILTYPIYLIGQFFVTASKSPLPDFPSNNGSWILGQSAIVCSDPTSSNQVDFWKMVWDTDAKNILMLTDCEEGTEYWPKNKDDSLQYGKITVTMTNKWMDKELIKEPYAIKIRQFSVDQEGYPSKDLWHFHLCGWDDHFMISSDLFFRYVQFILNHSKEGRVVVHDGNTFGKMGILLATLKIIQEIKQGNERPSLIGDVIEELNKERSDMIQNDSQHQLIRDTVNLWKEKNRAYSVIP